MAYRDTGTTALIEAIETLSNMTALDIDSPIAISEVHEVNINDVPVKYRTVHWLHQGNVEKVMDVVRGTFKIILNYIKDFYKKEYGHSVKPESLERIHSIMLLVRKAAKKIDNINEIFTGRILMSVREMKEYQDLSSFYKMKIVPIKLPAHKKVAFPHTIKKTAIKGEVALEKVVAHAYLDLDAVKKDTDYELFFISKENGGRFFHSDLINNINLLCHYDEVVTGMPHKDLYAYFYRWEDSTYSHLAKSILSQCSSKISLFFKEVKKEKSNKRAAALSEAIYALMLAAHEPRGRTHITKRPKEYFSDFIKFLRRCVDSSKGSRKHKMTSTEEKGHNLISSICNDIFMELHMPKHFHLFVDELINQGNLGVESSLDMTKLHNRLAKNYDALLRATGKFHNFPLVKILEDLGDREINGFDPQLLHNFPAFSFYLKMKHHSPPVLRTPTPTYQTDINKVEITEEFKEFLKHKKAKDRYLIFNLQDRTAWKEYARSKAIEGMEVDDLYVVSMAKESDFYHQISTYQNMSHADIFINELLNNVHSDDFGYHYPSKVKESLFPHFANELASQIHLIFFNNQNVLSRHSRLEFIDLYHLFLNMKIIEISKPDLIAFSCKDGLDVSFPSIAELFFSLKLLHGKPITHKEEDYMQSLLFGFPLIVRGRNLLNDRFSRFNNLIKVIESTIEFYGLREFRRLMKNKIEPLFNGDILESFGYLNLPN